MPWILVTKMLTCFKCLLNIYFYRNSYYICFVLYSPSRENRSYGRQGEGIACLIYFYIPHYYKKKIPDVGSSCRINELAPQGSIVEARTNYF